MYIPIISISSPNSDIKDYGKNDGQFLFLKVPITINELFMTSISGVIFLVRSDTLNAQKSN